MSSEKTKVNSVVCSNCGGQLEIDGLQDTVECPFCGTSYSVADLLDESDAVRIEKIKSQTYKEVEADKVKREIEKEKAENEKEEIKAFKKSKFSKVLIFFSIWGVLMCAVSFNDGKILSGIIAVILTSLFICSYLMSIKVIKEPKKGIRIWAAVIAFVLIFPYFKAYNHTSYDDFDDMEYEKERLEELQEEMAKFEWPDNELADLLPKPKSNFGHIEWEQSSGFFIYVGNTSLDEYKEYVKACREAGFTVDYNKGDDYYHASDSNGNNLSVDYEGNNIISISIENPDEEYSSDDEDFEDEDIEDEIKEKKNVNSSKSAIVLVAGEAGEYGELFTVNKGNEFEETYYVYHIPSGTYKVTNVGDYMSQVNVYSDELKKTEEGWDEYAETFAVELLDVNKSATITIGEGQHIHIDEPSKFKFEMQSSGTKEETKKDTSSDGISSDFKAAMDSYEKFFDEYVAIMKKYVNNPTDTSIISDYSKYMNKYAQMMEDFEKWEDEDMNAAETAYYIKVQGRISEKLLEVAQ